MTSQGDQQPELSGGRADARPTAEPTAAASESGDDDRRREAERQRAAINQANFEESLERRYRQKEEGLRDETREANQDLKQALARSQELLAEASYRSDAALSEARRADERRRAPFLLAGVVLLLASLAGGYELGFHSGAHVLPVSAPAPQSAYAVADGPSCSSRPQLPALVAAHTQLVGLGTSRPGATTAARQAVYAAAAATITGAEDAEDRCGDPPDDDGLHTELETDETTLVMLASSSPDIVATATPHP